MCDIGGVASSLVWCITLESTSIRPCPCVEVAGENECTGTGQGVVEAICCWSGKTVARVVNKEEDGSGVCQFEVGRGLRVC